MRSHYLARPITDSGFSHRDPIQPMQSHYRTVNSFLTIQQLRWRTAQLMTKCFAFDPPYNALRSACVEFRPRLVASRACPGHDGIVMKCKFRLEQCQIRPGTIQHIELVQCPSPDVVLCEDTRHAMPGETLVKLHIQ
jgi:hypothetical protein